MQPGHLTRLPTNSPFTFNPLPHWQRTAMEGDSAGSGTVKDCPHEGHFTRLPESFDLALKVAPHEHFAVIDIPELYHCGPSRSGK